jgi:hypothetical protein
MTELDDLKTRLRTVRLDSYVKLAGGFPIPLAGMLYWVWLAVLGARADLATWVNLAAWTSGLIFPLALILARLFRNDFMKEKGAVDSVLVPTFISMLLFWPMLFAAASTGPEATPLILAIGMSLHWPVIGWSYGRAALFSAHAVLRAVATTYLWYAFPSDRLTLIPIAVAAAYGLTIVAILIDVALLKRAR